jgi:hypothetical protein
MQFNEAEVRFLRQEHAMHGLARAVDLRELGCPAALFERILEARAAKLGPSFETFRANAVAPATADIDARIASNKLF